MSHVLPTLSVTAKYDAMNHFPYSSDIDSPFTYHAVGVPPEDVLQNCVTLLLLQLKQFALSTRESTCLRAQRPPPGIL